MKIIVGLTGASGSVLFKRTVELLNEQNHELLIIATDNGRQVFEYELSINFNEWLDQFSNVKIEPIDNMFSSAASGSSDFEKMMIVPCSMGTLGCIANGTSNNLLIRVADVFLKEKKTLVLALRESPLNDVHIRNLQILNNSHTYLVFQVPSFYNKRTKIEELIDDLVTRNLKYLGIPLPEELKWDSKQ